MRMGNTCRTNVRKSLLHAVSKWIIPNSVYWVLSSGPSVAITLLAATLVWLCFFGGNGVLGQQKIARTALATIVDEPADGTSIHVVRLPGNWFEKDAPPPVSPPPVPPPTREFSPNEINEITFDDVSFEILPGDPFDRSMLTENIRRLDGLKIRVRGFVKPSFKQTGIQKFVFVRDNQECCFGPGAAIYDCILVELGSGKSTDFTVRPVTLVGTFYLDEYSGPDGNIWAIFRMRDTSVE